jgi:type II secretory pathway component PulF
MKHYKAIVVNDHGKKSVVHDEAINRTLFEEKLGSDGWYVVSISKHQPKKSFFSSTSLKRQFVHDFSYNLYSLLSFGLDVNESFSILEDLFTNAGESQFIRSVHGDLGKGTRLSEAIRRAPGNELFNNFFFAMVKAGEASGNLTEAFRLINDFLKHMKQIRDQTISAIIYPVILMTVGFAALQLLLFMILPNFKQIFVNMQFQPTGIIALLFSFSEFLRNNWTGYLATLLVLLILGFVYSRTSLAGRVNSLVIMKAPVISSLYNLQAKIKVTFSLETLLRNGATLEESLQEMVHLGQGSSEQEFYRAALTELKNGGTVQKALQHIPVYGLRDLRIVEIADATSRTVEGFEKIHTDATEQFSIMLEKLLKLIEPLMIIFIALFIFLFMYLVISPTLFMMEKM